MRKPGTLRGTLRDGDEPRHTVEVTVRGSWHHSAWNDVLSEVGEGRVGVSLPLGIWTQWGTR